MAEVWLATDLTLDRRVAVKWLKPSLATDEIVAERFRREAKAAASLDHSNIVAVYDVFEQDGRQAVVMQLVDGKSLRQLLDTQKRLSPELTCHIGSAVAAALDHAHQAGFVHRDVKPGNIMITPDGRVLLTDFGIAKGLHGDSGDDLTSDNIMMGTAKYLSPEQVRGKKLDGRADLYSLGLVLYECLAGRVPFLGESDADTALARLQRDPTDLARLRATLPTRLVNVIHDLLARNPDHRPSTGAELIAELKAAAAEGPPEIDATNDERSPVAPFSAGRLMRAPSDLRGRSNDRGRGARTPTPPRGKTKRSEAPSRPTRRPNDRREPPHPSMLGSEPAKPVQPIDPILNSGRVAIPGEPPHITGRTPTTPAPTPGTKPTTKPTTPGTSAATTPATSVTSGRHDRVAASAATGVAEARRAVAGSGRGADDTPPSGHPLRGAPAREFGQRHAPSMFVVGGLIIVALAVAAVLWATLTFGGGESSAPTTALPNQVEPTADATGTGTGTGTGTDTGTEAGTEASAPAADADTADVDGSEPTIDPSDASIIATATFDPDGDLQEEDATLEFVTDGDPSTDWRTSCYSNEFMGAKNGVGIVVSFDTPIARPLRVDVASNNYIVNFYGAVGNDVPETFDGWGDEYDSQFGSEASVLTSNLPSQPVDHVLVLLQQLGPDDGCSETNPFRGRISEISFAD